MLCLSYITVNISWVLKGYSDSPKRIPTWPQKSRAASENKAPSPVPDTKPNILKGYITEVYLYQFTCITRYLTRQSSAAKFKIIRPTIFVAFRLLVCGSRVLFRGTYNARRVCTWLNRDIVCVYVYNGSLSVCDYNGSLSVCDSVVILPTETSSIRCRLRTRNHCKRSNAQTVKLKPKQCRAEPLAVEDPSAGGWAGYLQ
jgi:hypothetical protein